MDPAKDADGLHPMSLGRLVLNEPGPLPCTPQGIVQLLRRHGVEINGAHVVVVGRGITVGRSIAAAAHPPQSENATVTQCHTGTRDLPALLRQADIIVAAAGCRTWSSRRTCKPGAAVLDVGVSRDENGKIVGDVHPGVAEVAAWISPNPGGVGPMTRAQLLVNVVEAAERAAAEAQSMKVRVGGEKSRRFPPLTRDTARPEGGGRAMGAGIRALPAVAAAGRVRGVADRAAGDGRGVPGRHPDRGRARCWAGRCCGG